MTSIDAPQNLLGQNSEGVPPPPYGEPLTPFPSNLILTREKEELLDARAEQWFRELSGSSGWDETGQDEDWLINGLQPTDAAGYAKLNRKHFVKRAYYHAISENQWDHRRWCNGGDSIFARSNLNAPLARRIARAMSAKAIAGFFATRPYFVAYPVGPSDAPFSESIQKVAEHRLDSSGATAAMRDALSTAFDLGECVLKVQHIKRASLYRKNDVVLGDANNNVVLGQDGEYITENDAWTVKKVPDPRFASLPGAPVPTIEAKVLARDGVTQWPAGATWLTGSFARTVTHYKGPEITNIFYRNFLANWDARTLQEAECCIHMYEVSMSDLAAMFSDAQGTQLLQAIDVLRKLSGVNPVAGNLPDAGYGDGPAPSGKVKCQEYWMRVDADGDGVTEDVCYVRVNIGGGWQPLYYDYVANVTDTKQRPFYPIVPVQRKGLWHGIGAIEMFERHQEAVDLMLNRWAFSTSSSGRVTAYDPSAFELADGEDVDLRLNDGKALRLRPNRKLKDDAVQYLYLEDLLGDKWLAIFQTFMQLAMNESGVQHANDGGLAGMETTKLATGIRNVEKAGNENFGVFMACLEDGLQPAFRAFVQTLYARIEATEVARILEKNVPVTWTVEPRDVKGMEFDVTVMLSQYRSEQMFESVRAVLPDCVSYYSLPPIAQVRLAPLFHQLLKGAQIQNPEQIIVPMMDYSPEEIAASVQFAMSLPPETQQAIAPMMALAQTMMPQPEAAPQQQPAA